MAGLMMKRFYKDVSVAEGPEGWRVLLDGRAIKTVGGRPQALPGQALALAMAREWAEQGEDRPALFVLRDMADYALDVVAPAPPRRSPRCCPMPKPTLCYRADPDEPLFARQQAVWEPLLAGAENAPRPAV
jgi:chaperone required for assembly of F1-ATPase